MSDVQRLIDDAVTAHQRVLDAQEEMIQLSQLRDEAIAAAVAGGAGGATIGRALGISRSRISQILTNRGKQ